MIPKELLKIRRKPPRRRIRRHPCYVCGDDVRPWLKPPKPLIPKRLVCDSCARCIQSQAEILVLVGDRLRVLMQTDESEAERALERAIECDFGCWWEPNLEGQKITEIAAFMLRHTWRHLRPLRGGGRYFVPQKLRSRSRWYGRRPASVPPTSSSR